MDARLKYLVTPDKKKIYYEFWVPESHKAIILFLHGLGDHCARYGEFIRYFATHNVGVVAFDLLGHGKSSGRRGHIKKLNDYLRDIALIVELIRESYKTTPLFLAGHSFGGQLAVNFAAKYMKNVRGLILLSPNIAPLVDIPLWKKKLSFFASKWLPILKLSTSVKPEDLSNDETVVEMAKNDPLMNWHVTARLGAEILKNLEAMPSMVFQIKVPCLIMHGTDDKICSFEAARNFYHHIMVQRKEFKPYQGFYHELLNEFGREKVFADIEKWINNELATYERHAINAEATYGTKENLELWNYTHSNRHHDRA